MSLSVKDIRKSFGEKIILDGFSYDFPDRGIVAVSGESGIGKTTLLRIIAGLDKDFFGEVIGGGIGKVSFAFQEHRLFPGLSAIENIALAIEDKPSSEVLDSARNMLGRLGFSDSDMQLRPSALSGGMKQRVSLARAFLLKKDILLLDEPTKELDSELAGTVREIISEISQDRLVIMVTHNDYEKRELATSSIEMN